MSKQQGFTRETEFQSLWEVLVDTFTNTLVKELFGKEFIPRFDIFCQTFPVYSVKLTFSPPLLRCWYCVAVSFASAATARDTNLLVQFPAVSFRQHRLCLLISAYLVHFPWSGVLIHLLGTASFLPALMITQSFWRLTKGSCLPVIPRFRRTKKHRGWGCHVAENHNPKRQCIQSRPASPAANT